MKITVTTSSDLIFVLDVADDLELENFKAFCEVESGIPSGQIGVAHNGQLLMDDKKALKDYGISDGDVVIIDSLPPGTTGGGGGISGAALGGVAGGAGGKCTDPFYFRSRDSVCEFHHDVHIYM